jgi:hypothetical protein
VPVLKHDFEFIERSETGGKKEISKYLVKEQL